MMMHWFDGYPMGGVGFILMLLFWVLIIYGIVSLIRALSAKRGGEQPRETADDILKKRYAGGEIDKEEFDRIRRDLQA